MKITAIHGQLHQGSTYNITRLFLKKLGGENAEITEFFMPETPLLPVPVVAIVFSRVRTNYISILTPQLLRLNSYASIITSAFSLIRSVLKYCSSMGIHRVKKTSAISGPFLWIILSLCLSAEISQKTRKSM